MLLLNDIFSLSGSTNFITFSLLLFAGPFYVKVDWDFFLPASFCFPKLPAFVSAWFEFIHSALLIYEEIIFNLNAIAKVWLHTLNDLYLGQVEAWHLSDCFFWSYWTWCGSLGFLKFLTRKMSLPSGLAVRHSFVFNNKLTCSRISSQIDWGILQIVNIGILCASLEPSVADSLFSKEGGISYLLNFWKAL